MIIPSLKGLLIKSYQNWTKDNVPRLAAAFSFYAMLALSPTLVLIMAVASKILGDSESGERIVHAAQGYLGKQGDTILQSLLDTSKKPGASTIAGVISILLAIYGASNLFQQLSESIDSIWTVRAPSAGIRGFLLGKVIAIIMFIVFAAIFLVWLGIDSWFGWMEAHASGFQGLQLVSFIVSVVFLSLVFGVSYKILPKGMVAWSDVWFGAIVAAFGFGLSKFLLSLYFSYSTVSAAYGSAGSLVIILLWIYYSAQIYFFGIEITCTYAHMHGSQVKRRQGQEPIPVPIHART
jgi:membrane protein